jgi:hypothetical protein
MTTLDQYKHMQLNALCPVNSSPSTPFGIDGCHQRYGLRGTESSFYQLGQKELQLLASPATFDQTRCWFSHLTTSAALSFGGKTG